MKAGCWQWVSFGLWCLPGVWIVLGCSSVFLPGSRTGLSAGVSLENLRFRGLQEGKPSDERCIQRALNTFRLRGKRDSFPRLFRPNMCAFVDLEKVPYMHTENALGLAAPRKFSERHNFADGRRDCHTRGFPMEDGPTAIGPVRLALVMSGFQSGQLSICVWTRHTVSSGALILIS